MAFLKYFIFRFRYPYIYISLILNFLLAWPAYSMIIFFKNPDLIKTESHSWGHFFLSGYQQNLRIMLAVSLGTMVIFTMLYSWLRYNNDSVWERHYIRAIVRGALLGFINLFPIFFIYNLALGARDLHTIITTSLLGPLLSIVFVGPISILAGSVLGLINAITAHIFIVRENKKP